MIPKRQKINCIGCQGYVYTVSSCTECGMIYFRSEMAWESSHTDDSGLGWPCRVSIGIQVQNQLVVWFVMQELALESGYYWIHHR